MSYTTKSAFGRENVTTGGGTNASTSASYLLANSLNTMGLTDYRILTAGTGIAFTDNGALSTFVISATAPPAITDPTYLLLDNSGAAASYPNRRTIAAGVGISLTDGGAGNPLTIVNSNPTPFVDQTVNANEVWMDPVGGNDADPGTVTHPVKLIAAAKAIQLTKPVPGTNKGKLFIAPGLLPASPGNLFQLLANWIYEGAGSLITRSSNADALVLDPTFGSFTPGIVILKDIQWRGTTNLDFASVGSNSSSIKFENMDISNAITIIANTSNNTGYFNNLLLTGGWTQTGFDTQWVDIIMAGTNLTINSKLGVVTNFRSVSSLIRSSGSIIINYTAGHAAMILDLTGVRMETGNIQINITGVPVPNVVTVRMPVNYPNEPIITGDGTAVNIIRNTVASALSANGGLNLVKDVSTTTPALNSVPTANGAGNYDWVVPSVFADQSGASNQVWWDPVGGNDANNPSTVTHNVLTYATARTRQLAKPTSPNDRGVLIMAPRLVPSVGGTFALLPGWNYAGSGQVYTRFDSGDTLVLDPTWAPAGDWRTILSNLAWRGPVNINFATVTSNEGKIYAFNVSSNQRVNLTAFSSNNQGIWTDIILFAGWTQTGMNMFWKNVTNFGGDVIMNSMAGVATSLNAGASEMLGGDVVINYTAGHTPVTATLSQLNLAAGTVRINITGAAAANSVTVYMPDNYNNVPVITGLASAVTLIRSSVASALSVASGLALIKDVSTAAPAVGSIPTALTATTYDWVVPAAPPGASTYPTLTTTAPNVIAVADTNNLTPTGTYLNVIDSAVVGTLKLRGVRHTVGDPDAIVIKNDNANPLLVYHNNTGQPALPGGSFPIYTNSNGLSTVLLTGQSATLIWNATTSMWDFNPYYVQSQQAILAVQRKVAFTADISLAASTNNIKDFAGAYDSMLVENPTQLNSTSVGPVPFVADFGSFYIQYASTDQRFITCEFLASVLAGGPSETTGVIYELQLWRDGLYNNTICQFSSDLNNSTGRHPLTGRQTLTVNENATHTYAIYLVWSGGNGVAGKTLNFQYCDVKFYMSANGYYSV